MKAKEMFEELGYEQIKNNEDDIVYQTDILDIRTWGEENNRNRYTIYFCKRFETVQIHFNYGNEKYGYKEKNYGTFYKKDIEAIQKQIEELGWNR